MNLRVHCKYLPAALALGIFLWVGLAVARADSPPVNFSATADPPNPDPVWIGNTCTVGLHSTMTAAQQGEEDLTTTSQSWYITSVLYSADDVNWTTEWSGQGTTASVANFFDLTISGGIQEATISATLGEGGQAGYYQIAFSTTAYVSADVNGQPESGPVTTQGSTPPVATKLDITYGGSVVGSDGKPTSDPAGTVVTAKTTHVHAGWPIQLGETITPGQFANQFTKFTWTIAGSGATNGSAAINGWLEAVGGPNNNVANWSGTFYPLDPTKDAKATFPDPASTPTILQHYYYVASGNYNATVQTGGATARTTFAVAKVNTTMIAKYQWPTSLGAANGFEFILFRDPNEVGVLGALAHQAQYGVKLGYYPFNTVNQNGNTFAGTGRYLQVYKADEEYTGIAPIAKWTDQTAGLDTEDPYSGGNVWNDWLGTQALTAIGDAPEITTDKFANQVNYSPVKVNDSPEMWVMYKSTAVAGSIDVPLWSCPWNWGGTATYSAATKKWALANWTPAGAGNVVPGPAATSTYPAWTSIVKPKMPLN